MQLTGLDLLMNLLGPEDIGIPGCFFLQRSGRRWIKQPLEAFGIIEAVRGTAENRFCRHLGKLGVDMLSGLKTSKVGQIKRVPRIHRYKANPAHHLADCEVMTNERSNYRGHKQSLPDPERSRPPAKHRNQR